MDQSKPKFRLDWPTVSGGLFVLGLLGFVVGWFVPQVRPLGWLMLVPAINLLGQGLWLLWGALQQKDRAKAKASAAYLTMLLSTLNPFLLRQGFGQMLNMTRSPARYGGVLPSPSNYQQKTAYRLPFQGPWRVVNGGVDQDNSHSWELLEQRYAYDFVVLGPDGKSHHGSGDSLSDYHCFGLPILAVAQGVVVAVKDGHRDSPKPGQVDLLQTDIRGNFVVIRHAQGEYSISAHLKQHSVQVKVGQSVQQGQVIGLCGSSGNSSEPHLHFSINDTPHFLASVSLPVKFQHFNQDQEVVSEGYLTKEHTVQAV